MNAISLSLFVNRVEAICAEMGAILRRAAFSPNIKDRLDYSCALFDSEGSMFAQAAHIPVHLGSMAYAMQSIVDSCAWQPGDMLVVNDPFLGGTHLPDVTLVAPCFIDGALRAFVANRAHHANIGAEAPGSMPLSRHLNEEGMLIPPTMIIRGGELDQLAFDKITGSTGADTAGDFAAQISANKAGIERLEKIIVQLDVEAGFDQAVIEVNHYGERMMQSLLERIPAGCYEFSDLMDDDGFEATDIPIRVALTIGHERILVDFAGTGAAVPGNINCPLSVAAAGVFYAFRCLLPEGTPNCAGTFRAIELVAEPGCLLNAQRPAATAAGNVETSMRVVDVLLGALSKALPEEIPAASQGTMNNVAMGNHAIDHPWDYYETLAGGMGGSLRSAGLSAVHSHMTNTLNTPVESLELHYPLRILHYGIRKGSGGSGAQPGGDGLVREFLFLAPAEVTLLTERRRHAPWGLFGGGNGLPGRATLDGEALPGKCHIHVQTGQKLTIFTPGGGGYGETG